MRYEKYNDKDLTIIYCNVYGQIDGALEQIDVDRLNGVKKSIEDIFSNRGYSQKAIETIQNKVDHHRTSFEDISSSFLATKTPTIADKVKAAKEKQTVSRTEEKENHEQKHNTMKR